MVNQHIKMAEGVPGQEIATKFWGESVSAIEQTTDDQAPYGPPQPHAQGKP